MSMAKKTLLKSASVCSLLFASTASAAGVVELKSSDGLMTVQGEILGIETGMLKVQTTYGQISIPANDVACYGAACPVGVVRGGYEEELSVGFDDEGRRDLLVALLNAKDVAARSATTIEVFDGQSARVTNPEAFQTASLQFLSPGDEDGEMRVATESVNFDVQFTFSSASEWSDPSSVVSHHLAVQGLGVLLGPDTGVTQLSAEDLARIYSGEARNWSEFGGNDLAIQTLRAADGTAAHENLKAAVMTPFGHDTFGDGLLFRTEEQAAQVTSVARGAVAVVSLGAVGDANLIRVVNSCGAGIEPSNFAINTGDYPLTVATYAAVTSTSETQVLARVFDAAVDSSVLTDAGYADESILLGDRARTQQRIADLSGLGASHQATADVQDLMDSLQESEQLSMSFQDGPVSAATGAKSRADFVRLSEAILNGNFDGSEIHFVGFAKGADEEEAVENASTSAASILKAFTRFSPEAAEYPNVTFRTSGHGTAGKAFCAANQPAMVTNEVEIWVRTAS